MDNFYSLSAEDVSARGGYTLLKAHYQKSVAKAVMSIYSEHAWRPWKFSVTPQGWWRDHAKRRLYFDDAAVKLGIQSPLDWKRVPINSISQGELSSSFISSFYGGSIRKALVDLYPAEDWSELPSRSESVEGSDSPTPPRQYPTWRAPAGHWLLKSNRRVFFEKLASKLGYQTKEDWYQLSTEIIRQNSGAF